MERVFLKAEFIELGKEFLKKDDRVKISEATGINFPTLYPVLRGDKPTTKRNIKAIESYINSIVKKANKPIIVK